MTVIRFESKEDRKKREMRDLAYEIAQEATKRLDFKPDENDVLKDFRKKMGLPLKK
jgi:hypothetical protein